MQIRSECASPISPANLPRYAKFLRILLTQTTTALTGKCTPISIGISLNYNHKPLHLADNKPNPANIGKGKVSKEGEEDPFLEMAANIKSYMENERPYLNTQFSITDLSIALKAPQHHLLFCFNNILKLKFTDFRTSLRIDYAKEILLNGEGSQLSIEGISAKSGFSSRSSFYNAFKASTGLTPGEYILEQRGSAM
jgi:AraC-like DNA-binding protein